MDLPGDHANIPPKVDCTQTGLRGFTYNFAKMPRLTRLPSETLEAIISKIESRGDLLQLALTCSRLASLIIPRHLHWRTLRSNIEDGRNIWSALAHDRNLAQNVRVLELESKSAHLRSAPTIDPPISQLPPNYLDGIENAALEPFGDPLMTSEGLLRRALRNMDRLVSFQWGPVSPGPVVLDNSADIWHILGSLSRLRHINVGDWGPNKTPIYDSAVSSSLCLGSSF